MDRPEARRPGQTATSTRTTTDDRNKPDGGTGETSQGGERPQTKPRVKEHKDETWENCLAQV